VGPCYTDGAQMCVQAQPNTAGSYNHHNEKEPYGPDADQTLVFSGGLVFAIAVAVLTSGSKSVRSDFDETEYKSVPTRESPASLCKTQLDLDYYSDLSVPISYTVTAGFWRPDFTAHSRLPGTSSA
jgi:hypothetical protein